ncbi:uncharacterized protein FIBRA_06730 [Fibroporia radiculosa]|uniref:Cyclase n=1 Tax=Fibroporia radiculosa TaxID=599839 RepID=J4H484_9APHY|nr:uncharacterized protein FIBRA_06730 [Fibroporia radiculosa]CCM04549.1 predicted protein [Fibroporia radiculosa]
MLPTNLPTFDELPRFHSFSGCAWDVWGKDDELGTINLLTEEVVKEAAAHEIRLGKTICLNWPVNFPSKPMYGRQAPRVKLWAGHDDVVNDDSLHINTQSGTQWDGLRHFGLLGYDVFYNNTASGSFPKGYLYFPDPNAIDQKQIKLGIHNWAQHGICGRGVLLDLVRYYTASGAKLPYDPWTAHAIPVKDLEDCARFQGITFKQGDVLILRMGFIRRYHTASQEERDSLGSKPETFAGIEQSEDMKRFLWNNHFAAVASDQPALECWPNLDFNYLHQVCSADRRLNLYQLFGYIQQTLLSLFGMPIGEFFDLEKLSEVCAENDRHTFFFTSWPLNVLGGVASPANAAAYL